MNAPAECKDCAVFYFAVADIEKLCVTTKDFAVFNNDYTRANGLGVCNKLN